MVTEPTTPRPAPTDLAAAGAHLSGGFLAALVLVLPLGATLGTTTYGALYLWFLAGVAMVAAFGLLLRLAGVPHGVGLALAAAGAFAVAAPIALVVLVNIGAPADDTAVALSAGIPAAAVAAPVAATVVRLRDTVRGVAALGAAVCGAGFVVAALAGPPVGQAVLEAREDAQRIADLEAVGIEPLLPELDGAVADYSATYYSTPPGGVRTASGYSLRYEPVSAVAQSVSSSEYISVDVQLVDETPACEPVEGYLTCREGDGYTVIGRDGVDEEVVVEDGSIRLSANLTQSIDRLPEADEVGRALADAEPVDWNEIFDLEG